MAHLLQAYASILDYINSRRHHAPKKTEHALKLGVLSFIDIDPAVGKWDKISDALRH
jgi:hypothetical protein